MSGNEASVVKKSELQREERLVETFDAEGGHGYTLASSGFLEISGWLESLVPNLTDSGLLKYTKP